MVAQLSRAFGCRLVDLRAEFLKSRIFPTLIGADGIHPTQAGYLNWWTPKMEAYLYDYLGQ